MCYTSLIVLPLKSVNPCQVIVMIKVVKGALESGKGVQRMGTVGLRVKETIEMSVK